MKRSDLTELSRRELEYVLECVDCGAFFDCRNLDDIIFHTFGHHDRPPVECGAVMRLRVCADCDGTMRFVRRKWEDFVGFWKCGQCARIDWVKQPPKIWKPDEIKFT